MSKPYTLRLGDSRTVPISFAERNALLQSHSIQKTSHMNYRLTSLTALRGLSCKVGEYLATLLCQRDMTAQVMYTEMSR